ncbi:hypothetical protein BLJAPNOD_02939 [Ensifer sp. M14]|uniref:M15 family metallopeptidase n=1 Tax=Ensifer sp. M14 TaxID=2203782 RepID=UPI000E2BA45A|nr:M15 family metallopeptidase [Ensifer sp. M14]RDL51798.1 hypothetical protein BLJAPNOD_02939 [Ensifer sp. M14]
MVEKTDDLVISISTDLATVKRSLKRLEQDISSTTGKVQKQFDSLGKGIDTSMTSAMQARVDKMVGIGTKGAKEWSGALADQGKELERLRSKYSPLFATINNYKSAVSDIRRAHAVGAISANEMTAAIQRERQAALASTAAIKKRNAALTDAPAGRGSFNTSNLAAQGFDVATTAAFMPWYTVALQQGPQVSQVFNDIRAKGEKIGPAVAGAFTQILNPISLATIAVIGATAAAVQYFSTMEWGGGKSEETLKKEAELVQAVVNKWGEALPALKAYNDERQKAADAKESKEAAAIAADEQWTELRNALGDVNTEIADIVSRLSQMGEDTDKVTSLQRAFNELTTGIEDGTASSDLANKVQEELAAVIKDNATPELQKYLEIFEKLSPSIDKAATSASKFKTEAAVLADLIKQLGPLGQLSPILSGDGKFLVDQNDIQDYRARQAANENPTIVNGDGRTVSVPTPGAKPIQLGEEPNKKTETAATRAANAYRDLIKSADDRIAQLRLESELTGEYGVATDAARFRLELLQQAEDKGRSLSEAQRAQIEQKVAAYEKYSQALSEAKLQQDLLDDAVFAGMSKQEQAVKLRLRSYGLSEDMGGENAGSIRDQFQREELSDLTQSFLSEFTTGVVSGGKSIGESFADAIKNAAANAMQDSLDSLFTQIGNAFASAVFGSKGGGAASSALSAFPAAPSSLASAFSAPIGAVTRGSLPAAGTSKTGIGLSTISTAGGLTADVNAKFASQFQSLVNDLESTGYQIKSIGGYNHRNIAGTNKLSNHAYGNAIDINPQANPMGRNLVTDMPTGVSAIAARNGFNWGGDWKSKKDAMHFEISQAKSAGEALEKLAGASTETTKGLSSLATNLTSVGGGGGSSWLSFLSGTAFSGSKQLAASGGIGLFDKGGYTGAGGKYTPAGIVHKGEYVFDAAATSRIGVPTLERLRGYANGGLVGAPRAPRLNGRSSPANSNAQPGILQVHVSGANGDDHVRTLVKQGVGEALAAQNKNMERGGFGTMQARYGNQKG